MILAPSAPEPRTYDEVLSWLREQKLLYTMAQLLHNTQINSAWVKPQAESKRQKAKNQSPPTLEHVVAEQLLQAIMKVKNPAAILSFTLAGTVRVKTSSRADNRVTRPGVYCEFLTERGTLRVCLTLMELRGIYLRYYVTNVAIVAHEVAAQLVAAKAASAHA